MLSSSHAQKTESATLKYKAKKTLVNKRTRKQLKKKGTSQAIPSLPLIVILALSITSNIQPVKADSTITINSDGSVNPSTAPIQRNGYVYTLTSSINASIAIQRNNTVLDGKGYSIQGKGTDRGISLYSVENVTIKNTQITGFSQGIQVSHTTKNTITNNTITNSTYAILADRSPRTTILNNTIENNQWDGIFITASPDSLIIDNKVTNQSKWGIYLGYSPNSTLKNNTMKNNRYNFGVAVDFVHDIDTSNIVDGKPIYYWINRQNSQVPADAGYVAIVNSIDIEVKNLNLTKNGQGIILVYSVKILVENCSITSNGYYGILATRSNYNIIRNNTFTSNEWGGIALIYSASNIVNNNVIKDTDVSLYLVDSTSNIVDSNTIKKSDEGIYLQDSAGNTISENTVEDSNTGIYLLDSNDNTIYNNNFIDNSRQTLNIKSTNKWDGGYPLGGNYWSDNTGQDANGDGIGDTPYIIDYQNQDNYPLMHTFQKSHSTNAQIGPILLATGIAAITIATSTCVIRRKRHS